GQAEHPLLEDRVPAVPQRQREAEALLVVGDAGQPVLAPAVRARAGLVVAEVRPGVARVAVVLADRSPLALREIRSPLTPGSFLRARLCQSTMLGCHSDLLPSRTTTECAPARYGEPGTGGAVSHGTMSFGASRAVSIHRRHRCGFPSPPRGSSKSRGS